MAALAHREVGPQRFQMIPIQAICDIRSECAARRSL